MAHHIVILGETRQSTSEVYLLPNSDGEETYRMMGAPDRFTHLFCLSTASAPNGSVGVTYGSRWSKGVMLKEVAWRPPTLIFENIKQQLRTRWLGRASPDIESEMKQLMFDIEQAAAEMARPGFPIKI